MQEPVIFRFSFDELHIDRSVPLKYMGYENETDIPEPVLSALDSLFPDYQHRSEIRGAYLIEEEVLLERHKRQLIAGGKTFNTGKVVSHQLMKAEKAAFFLCTAGEYLSELPGRYMKEGDMVSGYCADILSNVVVETAMDRIQQHLKEQMEKAGLLITNRYSPGYCEWDVAEQDILFSLFPDNFPGISLTSSFMMKPVKSVSGIIGIGREVRYNDYSCHFCADVHCVYRKKKDLQAV